MKLTVIGGGGVRSMFLAKSIAQKAAELHITELVFMDNDGGKKLRIYGGLGRACLPDAQSGAEIPVDHGCRRRRERCRLYHHHDSSGRRSHAGARGAHRLGQRCAGTGNHRRCGLSFAMRSVPALAEYCELIRQYAKPTVKVFNFTNPAGVVSQTLRDMGYGLHLWDLRCPSGMLHQFADLYGVSADRIVANATV